MNIRPAAADELHAISDVHRHAFASSGLGHNGEARLVQALHDDGDVACSVVAEADGALIGHALFSRMAAVADGVALRAAALAPVSVLPESQNRGIGSGLINAGLQQLLANDFQISFVLGHPDFYSRFGFCVELGSIFESPFAGPHFMAVHLDTALKLPQRGRAEYAPAFARMG